MKNIQNLLDPESRDFWIERQEERPQGRWIEITDGIPVDLEIRDWTIHHPKTVHGYPAALIVNDDKFFAISARYITDLLKDHVGSHIKCKFIRYNSKPDSSKATGEIQDLVYL